jgi:chemotaxis protein histidine kinase CheA/ActR/RegA family two-component response regulator
MNGPSPEMIELFLQEASEHLQFLREYSGILQDPYPLYEDIERLYISAHSVAGTSGTYGYPLFHEVAGKLAHIFQYAMNATISPEATAPLVEFIYEAIAVLESDLIMISANGVEAAEDIAAFQQRFPFAFQALPAVEAPAEMQAASEAAPAATEQGQEAEEQEALSEETAPIAAAAEGAADEPFFASEAESAAHGETATVEPSMAVHFEEITEESAFASAGVQPEEEEFEAEAAIAEASAEIPPGSSAAREISFEHVPELEADEEVPAEVLEFFVPEVEEHLQIITDCLLAIESNSDEETIHRLFRSMHTIKGSAAQVGWQRISTIAHRAEDLIGRLREGELKPNATSIDLCLETVDVLKKLIYRQWEDEAAFQLAARSLIARLESVSLVEEEGAAAEAEGAVAAVTAQPAPHPASLEPLPLEAAALQTSPLDDLLDSAPVAPTQVSRAIFADSPSSLAAAFDAVLPQSAMHELEPLDWPAEPLRPAAPAEARIDVSAPLYAQAPAVPSPVEELLAKSISAPELAEALPGDVPGKPSTPPVGMAQSKSVRIGLERLDRMMNAVGELVINRTRMLGRLAELEKLAEVLNFSKGRMSEKVTEFQEKYEFSRIGSSLGAPMAQWRGAQWPGASYEMRAGEMQSGGYGYGGFGGPAMGFGGGYGQPGYGGGYGHGGMHDGHSEFSELEMDRYDDFGILSRSLTEISADISEVLTQLDGFVRRVDGDIDEFTKLAHRLQDEITAARMVPIGNLFTRITRTVRDAAKASAKQVELTLAGAETELDNNIIQQISDPLLHLVRNAVAHGIEGVDERYEAGKPDHGSVAVRAYHRGNHIYIEVEDDGSGVDFERIKAAGVERGFISADEAERMGRRELLDLLFRPGFSTSQRRTELAGRGVGLDVVQTNLTHLNGEIEIETEKGIGTRFTLKVPLTLIISQALFVQCGEQTFAFPLAFVEEIRRIRPSEIEEVSGKLIAKVRDVITEVVRLDEVLQLPRLQPVNGYLRLVVVNVGGRQVGVVVEEVLRKDEIVIKNLGEYLRQVKLFPGATIAPDGSLILLVDLNRLIMGESIERRPLTMAMNAARLFLPGAAAVAHGEIPAAAIDVVEKEKLVVLADDSISVRKFVGRMLEKAGYRIKLACDGLEALEIATSNDCDLVITDLEMPRTNGYELMMHLRQTPSTSKVPVMVVTSRAGAKHRDRALKEGAAAFMVKPVQEETFIAQVVQLIGTSGQTAVAEEAARSAPNPPVVQ